MNYEELAFVNRQLAAMIRSGLPLEGGLRQLSRQMRNRQLKQEMAALEEDLAQGIPLPEAVSKRQLPELYKKLVAIGAQGGNLAGILVLLADHYQAQSILWTRLRGLMVYPVIVLVGCLVASIFLGTLSHHFFQINLQEQQGLFMGRNLPAFTEFVFSNPKAYTALIFAPTALVAALLAAIAAVCSWPSWRRGFRWRLPILLEASCAQLAATLHLLMAGGCSLRDAVQLLGLLEKHTRLGRELAAWQERLSAGAGRFAEMVSPSKLLPPLFVWVVASAGEDLPGGLKQAADLYQARAVRRGDVFLNAFLPVSVMLLGVMVATQAYSLFAIILGASINMMGLVSGL